MSVVSDRLALSGKVPRTKKRATGFKIANFQASGRTGQRFPDTLAYRLI